MNGTKSEEKGGKPKQSKLLIFFYWLFQVDPKKGKPELSEWSVDVIFTTSIITTVYMLVKKHNWEATSEKVSILSVSTALPLLTFISILILEVIGGIRQMFIERVLEKERKAKFEKAVAEARAEGKAEGSREKHEEWVEWADNGRHEDQRPQPPEKPKHS